MLFAGALTLASGLAIGERADLREISAEAVVAFAYLVVPGSIVAYTAFVWLLQNASVSTATTYAYVNPVVALFLGWALVDEQIGPVTLASALLIVVAVAVVLRRDGDVPPKRRSESAGGADTAPLGAVRPSTDRRGAA